MSGTVNLTAIRLKYACLTGGSIETLCQVLAKQKRLKSLFLRHVREKISTDSSDQLNKYQPERLPNKSLIDLFKAIEGLLKGGNLKSLHLD